MSVKNIVGVILAYTSLLVGAGLWIWSVYLAYTLAGILWMIVGILLFGFGVVFVAFIASLLHSLWMTAVTIAALAAAVYVSRFLGSHLTEEKDRLKNN